MLKYIILGITQGFTEFLPVSSSGHLVIMQRVLGMYGEEVAVSVVLHLGTCLALIIFFFRDILNLLRNIRLLSLVLLATLITGVIGIAGKDFFESLFSSPKAVAIALTITALVLILTKKYSGGKKNEIKIKDALIFGVSQGAAIVPGISRSGITISTLLFRGFDAETCFRFSFIASIPAVLGAALLEAKDISFCKSCGSQLYLAGFIFSFLSGLLALVLLKKILLKAKFHYFAYYCLAAAIFILLFI